MGRHQISIAVFVIFLAFFNSRRAHSEVLEAASCEQSDVQSVLVSAASGDIVIVPPGSCIWASEGNYQPVFSIPAEVTLYGSGSDQTQITFECSSKNCRGMTGDGNQFRISGFSFDGAELMGCIRLSGEHRNIRIDHNRFTRCRGRAIETLGYIDGVIDHNEFIDNSASTDIVIYGDDESAWSRPILLGQADGVAFIEDNTFIYTSSGYEDSQHAVASNHGARYVFRYNLIDALEHAPNYLEAPIDAHGYCYYGRGTVSYEIYENEIRSHRSFRGMFIRGGTGVIFNNRFIGDSETGDVDFEYPIHLTNYRSCSECGTEEPTCTEGYPCQDQIRDLYIWGNTVDGEPVGAEVDGRCDAVIDHIQENRDYFHDEPSDYEPYDYPHPLTVATEPCPGICCESGQSCSDGIFLESADCGARCCVGAASSCTVSGEDADPDTDDIDPSDADLDSNDADLDVNDSDPDRNDAEPDQPDADTETESDSGCSCRQVGSGTMVFTIIFAFLGVLTRKSFKVSS